MTDFTTTHEIVTSCSYSAICMLELQFLASISVLTRRVMLVVVDKGWDCFIGMLVGQIILLVFIELYVVVSHYTLGAAIQTHMQNNTTNERTTEQNKGAK